MIEDRNTLRDSGMLELYALGALSETENYEVERILAQNPDLQAEVDEIRSAFESMATVDAVEPPLHLRAQILDSIANIAREEQPVVGSQQVATERTSQATVHYLPTPKWKYGLVAGIGIAIGLLPSFWYKNESSNLQERLATTQRQLEREVQSNSVMALKASTKDKLMDIVANTSSMRINLAAVKNAHGAAMVYYHSSTKQVVLDARSMPQLASDKDYQLWAIVDGKPHSLGVFSPTGNASDNMMPMDAVGKPQAFAVTIEPKGGRPTPTMENMVVIGMMPSKS